MTTNDVRKSLYPRDEIPLDQPLIALNEALEPLERALIQPFDIPRHPVIFIVGAPRSGTTLLAQLIISNYIVGYTSNLAARFWKAPYLGMLLAAEFQDHRRPPDIDFSSNLGATGGYEGPHEFGYFWRRWFKYEDTHCVSEHSLEHVEVELLLKECSAVQSVSDSPFLFKNLVCSFQVKFLAALLPNAIFVHCVREPFFAAQSLLHARVQYCGSKEAWFSVKPEAYLSLRERDYVEQVVGQVFYTRRHVEDAFALLPSDRFCNVGYEELTSSPGQSLARIATLVEQSGGVMRLRERSSLPALAPGNTITVETEERELLGKYCEKYFSKNSRG